MDTIKLKILLFANTDWFLYNFRLPLAKDLVDAGHQVLLVSPGGDYADRMSAEGFHHRQVRLSQKGTNPLREIQSIIEIIRLYKQEKPDVVHHFTIKPVLYGSLAAKLTSVLRIVNSITGLGYVFTSTALMAKILKCIVKTLYRGLLKNTAVIFENTDDRKLFIDLKLVNSAQSAFIPGSGVDIKLFTPSDEPPEPVTVLLPARLLYSKGIVEYVNAARLLKKQGVTARFVLAGDIYPGNPDHIEQSMVDGWINEGVVEWMGWQSDMAQVLKSAHIVCLPSYREGLPKALAEAAASGKPIVATDVPGCREIVRHGENGLLVPNKNVEALAEALKALIENPEIRKSMGEKSRKLAETQFSYFHVNRHTVQLYKLTQPGSAK